MMEPEVRYCMTSDGVRIAYTVTGEGPPLVLCAEPVTSHTQLEWSRPVIGPLLREFARRNTLIRFDPRGSGLSDRVLPQTLNDCVLDIEAVVKRTGFSEFAMSGVQLGTPAAIGFAAHHTEQVSRFAIVNGFARVSDFTDTPGMQALLAAAQADWVLATEAVGFTVFGSGREESRNWGAYIRSCIGQEYFDGDAVKLVSAWDATNEAQMITAPTLIMKHSGLQMWTIEMARDLAARIPNSQLVIVEGTWADDPASVARRVVAFLNDTPDSPPDLERPPSGTAIILFADIADSTALTERLGDAVFRAKARKLDDSLRAVIREHDGTAIEGKLLGDAVLAVFTSARQAIEASIECGRAGDESGLPIHLGLHAGDVIREDNNVYGGAVNIASRISVLSAPGEVLVSDIVRGLARTSAGVRFDDRGEQSLKGVGDPVRVWAVREAD
jgi:class 3 adenylate cyclase